MLKNPRILISTGELSGDYHASNLVKAIKKISPGAVFFGVGSHNLESAGVELLYDSSDWGGIGMYANLVKTPVTMKAGRELIKKIPDLDLDLLIVVDFRVFHATLLNAMKDQDFAKLYYFAPVLWPGFETHSIGKMYSNLLKSLRNRNTRNRFEALAELTDKLIVAYPFAVDDYVQAGADVEFLGHPLMNAVKADKSRDVVRRELGLDDGAKLIGIFPGSRTHELKSHLPVIRQVILKLSNSLQHARFFIPTAHPEHRQLIGSALGDSSKDVMFVKGDDYNIFNASDLAITKTGTSVQVLMALGVPTVAFYTVVSSLWYNISIRYMVRFDHIAFPNVMAGRRIIPEFIQDDFNADNIVRSSLDILNDPERSKQMKTDLLSVREELYREDALEKAAEIAVNLANRTGSKVTAG